MAAYKRTIIMLRKDWLRVPTPSGRPKKGPRFYAIAQCEAETGNQLGLVSSGDTKGKRWACLTCFGFMVPVWTDGPLPDIEDIREEWANWMAKGNRQIRKF